MLPENLTKDTVDSKAKVKPIIAKYTIEDMYYAAYQLLLAKASGYTKKRMTEDIHGEAAQRFSRAVANFAEDNENLVVISDYLLKNPRKS